MASIGDGNGHGNAFPMNGLFIQMNSRFVPITSDPSQKAIDATDVRSLREGIRQHEVRVPGSR